jgi:LuxR family maltose regulon positive regulatory protein
MPPPAQARNDWILRTKLHRPQLPPDLVERARVLELLEKNPERPFTLVSAPAGCGKSTLVSRWLEASEQPAAWLSLDDGDNDLRVFLRYLVAAVRTHSPKACRQSHEFLGAAELPPPAVLGDCFSNELDAIKRRFVLVLDDYHRIRERSIHELVDQLLRHPCPSCHLVLVTRRDPPLALAGLRARGRALEVREQDLRFTAEETRIALQAIGGVSIGDETLAHLQGELEGWITGLRLVCLMLRHEEDPEGFLGCLHGGSLNIQQYLVEEVLKHLPPGFEKKLLKTSILNRLCVPLCEAVCAGDGPPGPAADEAFETGEGFLRELQRANLFAIPLDAKGKWVRYHHLFQQLLQQQLESRASAEEIATLHGRASNWFEAGGFREEALQHALRAGKVEKAAALVERHRTELMDNDTWHVLERWLGLLPDAIRKERPHLLLAEAWTAYERFQLDRIPVLLQRVDALVGEGAGSEEVRGERAYFLGALAYWSGEGADAQRFFEEARSSIPESRGLLGGLVELLLGLARCMCGEKERGIAGLSRRIRDADATEGIFTSRLIAGLIFIHELSGDPVRTRREAQRMRVVAKKSGIAYTERWAAYKEACSHFYVNELEQAVAHFEPAVRHRYTLHTRAAVDALAGMAVTRQLLGQTDAATEAMELLQAFALELGEPQFLGLADSCRARLAVLQGDLPRAFRWAQSFHDDPVPPASFIWLEVPWISQARVLIAEGSTASLARAGEVLDAFRRQSEDCRFINHVIEAAALQPLVLEQQGRREEALGSLRAALELAAPGGWIRPFFEAGPAMAELLGHLSADEQSGLFVAETLAAFAGAGAAERAPAGARPVAARQPLIEPLTNRELDVLELLAKRLQDKEIAESLCVSVGTVKTHLKHIYGKLEVGGRREAASKAEELGII